MANTFVVIHPGFNFNGHMGPVPFLASVSSPTTFPNAEQIAKMSNAVAQEFPTEDAASAFCVGAREAFEDKAAFDEFWADWEEAGNPNLIMSQATEPEEAAEESEEEDDTSEDEETEEDENAQDADEDGDAADAGDPDSDADPEE